MCKFILTACWWIFLANSALAAEPPTTADIIYIKAPQKITENAEITQLPDCNDTRLEEALTAKIATYYGSNPDISLFERRRQLLTLKNIKVLSESDVANFTPRHNYQVADRIIMAKINHNIDERSLRLCKSEKAYAGTDIYILMYPFENQIKAEIINFGSLSPDRDNFYILLE